MTATEVLPIQLGHFLDAGGDLTAVPDLDNYARVIMNRHLMDPEERESLTVFFLDNYLRWEMGGVVLIEGVVIEKSMVRMRHALWLAEALHDDVVAERFVAALPAELREKVEREQGG
ncbi:MAG: hypothetical protein ACT4PX_03425 [Actinomycetota bacterium]